MTENLKTDGLVKAIREGIESGEPTAWDPEELKREGRKRLGIAPTVPKGQNPDAS